MQKNELLQKVSDVGISMNDIDRARQLDPSFDSKVQSYANKLSTMKTENEVREIGEEIYSQVSINRDRMLTGTKGLDLGETTELMNKIAVVSTDITEQYEKKGMLQKWFGGLKKRQISHADIVSQLDVVEGNINKVVSKLQLSMDTLKAVGTNVRKLGDDLLPVIVALENDIENTKRELSMYEKDSVEYLEKEYELSVKMNRVKELSTLRLISREQTRECLLIYNANLHWIQELKHNSKIVLPVLQHVAMQRVGINAGKQAASLSSALKEVTEKSLEIAGRDIADNLAILQTTKEGLLSVDTIEKVIDVVNNAVAQLQESRKATIENYDTTMEKIRQLDENIGV